MKKIHILISIVVVVLIVIGNIIYTNYGKSGTKEGLTSISIQNTAPTASNVGHFVGVSKGIPWAAGNATIWPGYYVEGVAGDLIDVKITNTDMANELITIQSPNVFIPNNYYYFTSDPTRPPTAPPPPTTSDFHKTANYVNTYGSSNMGGFVSDSQLLMVTKQWFIQGVSGDLVNQPIDYINSEGQNNVNYIIFHTVWPAVFTNNQSYYFTDAPITVTTAVPTTTPRPPIRPAPEGTAYAIPDMTGIPPVTKIPAGTEPGTQQYIVTGQSASYTNGTYSITGSSFLNKGSYTANNVFCKGGNNLGWESEQNMYQQGNSSYIGQVSVPFNPPINGITWNMKGEYVSITVPYNILLHSYGVDMPYMSKWTVAGSNDSGASYTFIDNNNNYNTYGSTSYTLITPIIAPTVTYSTYIIIITSVTRNYLLSAKITTFDVFGSSTPIPGVTPPVVVTTPVVLTTPVVTTTPVLTTPVVTTTLNTTTYSPTTSTSTSTTPTQITINPNIIDMTIMTLDDIINRYYTIHDTTTEDYILKSAIPLPHCGLCTKTYTCPGHQ